MLNTATTTLSASEIEHHGGLRHKPRLLVVGKKHGAHPHDPEDFGHWGFDIIRDHFCNTPLNDTPAIAKLIEDTKADAILLVGAGTKDAAAAKKLTQELKRLSAHTACASIIGSPGYHLQMALGETPMDKYGDLSPRQRIAAYLKARLAGATEPEAIQQAKTAKIVTLTWHTH